ncbi:hypothetical protein [Atlantibacter hermannii]|uniref:hypothetical protein n=1 Tax=Atlantibacter hermannii TaxID=565 RepID=UPI002897F27A|nr:hypothetical protein [Atlantibacter hermannii]
MVKETCSSDLLAQKLQQMYSLLQIVKRTLDSNEGSIYLQEAIDLMSAAGNMAHECEAIRQRLDVELYQQSSKYYEQYSPQHEQTCQ